MLGTADREGLARDCRRRVSWGPGFARRGRPRKLRTMDRRSTQHKRGKERSGTYQDSSDGSGEKALGKKHDKLEKGLYPLEERNFVDKDTLTRTD